MLHVALTQEPEELDIDAEFTMSNIQESDEKRRVF